MAEEGNRDNLPPCGLYRTSVALPGKEEQVPAGRLVYFHNHSEQGPPLVLLPSQNTNNKWTFHTRGYLIESAAYVDTLQPLPREGFYTLRANLTVGEGFLTERSLVQLGYNPKGEPILFLGERKDNSIFFPKRGAGFKSDTIFKELDPVNFIIRGEAKTTQAPKPPGGTPGGSTPPTLH